MEGELGPVYWAAHGAYEEVSQALHDQGSLPNRSGSSDDALTRPLETHNRIRRRTICDGSLLVVMVDVCQAMEEMLVQGGREGSLEGISDSVILSARRSESEACEAMVKVRRQWSDLANSSKGRRLAEGRGGQATCDISSGERAGRGKSRFD